ncbi:MAG: hypothetical protein ABL951_14435, partial [Alphaproteobacteria bacterium]
LRMTKRRVFQQPVRAIPFMIEPTGSIIKGIAPASHRNHSYSLGMENWLPCTLNRLLQITAR